MRLRIWKVAFWWCTDQWSLNHYCMAKPNRANTTTRLVDLIKLVRDALGAEFYGFELDVVGVSFEGDLADECGKQFFVLAFVGPVG